jgi:gliding motility-associated-like protein
VVSVSDTFDLRAMTDSTRFKPYFRNTPDEYSFEIRHSDGSEIFKTEIPEQGWNGLRNNRKGMCANAVYRWVLNCKWTGDSTTLSCTGFVSCTNMEAAVKVTALDTLQCQLTVFVPGAFTPNGDTFNDAFMPVFGCPPVEYEMFVFDRWGNLIFRTTEVKQGWDGGNSSENPSEMDTYLWRIKCKFYEGDKKREFTGHVALIR